MNTYFLDATNGNDGNDGSTALLAFKTTQHALDVAVPAAPVNGIGALIKANGTETLAAIIDIDTNQGTVALGRIRLESYDATFTTPTVGGLKLNANSAIASIFKGAAKALIDIVGVEMYGCTGYAIVSTAAYCYGWRFINNIIRNCVGGINLQAGYFSFAIVAGNKIHNITNVGIYQPYYQCLIYGNEIYLCSGGGIQCYAAGTPPVIVKNIIRDNLVFGVWYPAYLIGNVIDNCVVGWEVSASALGYTVLASAKENTFTNNTTAGIRLNVANSIAEEDYNLYYNNGADRSITGANSFLNTGGNSVDTAVNPYVDQPNKNYARIVGSVLRYTDITMPGGITHRQLTAGLTPVPDFPSVANTSTTDTTDTVTGTNDKIYSQAEYEADNTDMLAANVKLDLAYVTRGTNRTGELSTGLNVPDAITISIVLALSSTSLRVSFAWAANAATIEIYRAATSDGVYSKIATLSSGNYYDDTGRTAATSYWYKARGVNATGNGAYGAIVNGVTSATTDILTLCEARIKADIEALRIVNGYNYDWGVCNQTDMAKKDAFPNAEIYFPDEENLDDKDGTSANSYTNDTTVEIDIIGALTSEVNEPSFSINTVYNKAIDDLKKCFTLDASLNGNCYRILYAGWSREPAKDGEQITVGKLKTRWVLTYAQDRDNPTLTTS